MSSVSSLNSLLSSSSSSTTSSSLNLSSLLAAATGASSTGIDVTSAVAAAVYAAQAPERQWQAQQTTVKSQITTLSSIQTALSSLSADLDSLNNLSGPLTARSVTSSSPAITATATAASTAANHLVTVSSLATSASWYGPSLPSSTSPLGATKVNLVAKDGTTTTFTTGSGVNTLSALASAINSSGLGVNASIVNDATGARLALVGTSSGAASDFSVNFAPVSGTTWSSASVASASATLSAGSFQIGDGQSSATVSVSAGDTLTDIANRINTQGLDLSASVVTDSSGAHLALSSTTGGSLSITGDPVFSMTRASSANNASLTVDGIPISSATNTVSGAVDGVTLNLLGTTTGQATLTVASDNSQTENSLSQFVTDYNAALKLVSSQFAFDPTSSSQGVLSGDSTLRSLQAMLGQIVSYTAPSSITATSPGSSLASLGISMRDDGSLSLDTAKLKQASAAGSSTVRNFFQGAALNGFAQTFQTQLKTFTSASTGALAVEIKNLNGTYTTLQSQVDDYETGYIASQKTVLTAMYSKAEIALQSLPTTLKQLEAQLGNNSGK